MGRGTPELAYQDLLLKFGGQRSVRALRDGTLGSTSLDEDELQEFRDDVTKLRHRLRKQNFGLLNPRGLNVQRWDLCTALALMYTLFVTPYEVGMNLKTKLDTLFWINQVVTLFFMVDIVVQFFLPVPIGDDGTYERKHCAIAKRYLKSWFVVDIVSVLPFDVLILFGLLSGPVKSAKMFRILRLLKTAKVMRASSMIERWESKLAIPSATMSLMAYCFLGITLLHWFACGYALVPQLQPSQRGDLGSPLQMRIESGIRDRLDSLADSSTLSGSICTGCIRDDASTHTICSASCLTECEREVLGEMTGARLSFIAKNENWICRAIESGNLPAEAAFADGAPYETYVTCLLISMLQLVGSLSGQMEPANTVEYFFNFAAILCGTVLFAAIQGIICGVVTTGDPDETLWKQQNDKLNFMMEDCKVTPEMRQKVRMYFRRSKKMLKRRSYDSIIDECLSDDLQGDVRFLVSMQQFRYVPWLWAAQKLEDDKGRQFLEDLSMHLTRKAFAKGEMMTVQDDLTILARGVASRCGFFMTAGAYWGDIVVTNKALRDTTAVSAVTHCEVVRLERFHLYDVAKDHPEAEKLLKFEGLKLAMRRAMVAISLHEKTKQIESGGTTGTMNGAGASVDALQAVLHPNPDETWQTVEAAREQFEAAQQAPPRFTRTENDFLERLGHEPPRQQAVSIAKLLLDVTKRLSSETDVDQSRQVLGVPHDNVTRQRPQAPTRPSASASFLRRELGELEA